MDVKIQDDFDRNFGAVRAHSNNVQSENLHAAIRDLSTTIRLAKKLHLRLVVPPELPTSARLLMENSKLPPDLAIMAGRMHCLSRIFFQNEPDTIEELLAEFSVMDQSFAKICFLVGIIDSLPGVAEKYDSLLCTVGDEILKILSNFNTLYIHQMKLLFAWLQHIKSNIHLIPASSRIRTEFLLPQSELIRLINLHWETPLVQTLSEQCLVTICEIWKAFQPSSQYADILAKATLTNLSWKSKAKFLILATLLPFLHFSEVLCEYPDTIYAMTGSLEVNCLLPAGTTLFKALAKHLTPEEWEDYCQSVLLDALNHPNRITRQNAAQYWLPALSQCSHVVFTEFKQRLWDAEKFNWLAYVTLLKLAGQLSDKERSLVKRAIHHGEEEVRVISYGVFLHSPKKIEPIKEDDWRLLLTSLPNNLHSDNPQYRLKLLSIIRVFLIRVLESCLHRMKQGESLDKDIGYVRELHDIFLDCLTPLASYQRRLTALCSLKYILQLFGKDDALAESLVKNGSLTKRSALIDLAGDRWDWTALRCLDRYSVCLMDEIVDIRTKAAEILKDFFHSPPASYIRALYRVGIKLCDSPKFQRSECGAAIIQLFNHWTRKDGSVLPDHTVKVLMSEIKSRFQELQLDWMAGASSAPVHGFIGALNKTLQLSDHQDFNISYRDLIRIAQAISSYMLDTLSSRSTASQDMAPSFEEMSQAIDDIVRRNNTTGMGDSITISYQQQLVLACAWLNLKESCNLAVQVATLLLGNAKVPESEKVVQIEECAQVIYQILVRCRHKGAIEAAGEAMGVLSRRLFASSDASIKAIPGNMLLDFLQKLSETRSGANVTRRSAGLAFLVVKIVSSQPEKSSPDSLLAVATSKLISIAQRPVVVGDNDEEIRDMPQALAMHILKSLVNDASLSGGLQPELMVPIIRLSIDSFSHPDWSIRNAALQLHGAIIPRLMGQTCKTTAELFHKLPGLEPFLLNKLTEETEKCQLISGGLIPSLTLICRLSPSSCNESFNASFISCLKKLMGHPVVQVRQLTAKSLLAFVPLFKTKSTTILLCEDAESLANVNSQAPLRLCIRGPSRTNSLHGCILAIDEFLNRCQEVALSVEDWEIIRKAVSGLAKIEKEHPCYYIKLAILKLFEKLPGITGEFDFFACYRKESVRRGLQHHPGLRDWLRLKTELVVKHLSLNSLLPAIDGFLPYSNGLDVVEPAFEVLRVRLMRLSSSSVLANTVTGFVSYYMSHWQCFPTLLPACLDFIRARGAKALQESDSSLRWFIDFFLDKCIDSRELGSSVALAAMPAVSIVIKECVEKKLYVDGLDEIIARFSRILLDASQPEESLAFRYAAALCLSIVGNTLLNYKAKNAEASRNLFLLVVNVVEDEEEDVRASTALFVTDMLLPPENDPFGKHRLNLLSPSRCAEELAHELGRWFDPSVIVKILDLMGESTAVKEESSQSLYEPDRRSFFHEERESMRLIFLSVRSLCSLLKKGGNSGETIARRLLDEAEEVITSLEADFGTDSMLNEWLFTRSVAKQSALTRVALRLNIIHANFPSWTQDQRYIDLHRRLERLNPRYTSCMVHIKQGSIGSHLEVP